MLKGIQLLPCRSIASVALCREGGQGIERLIDLPGLCRHSSHTRTAGNTASLTLMSQSMSSISIAQ